MKFINREYGFEGRPPFFKDFYEESSSLPFADKAEFPGRPVVGFGLDPEYPNGVLLAGCLGTVWGLRYAYQKGGRWLSDEELKKDKGRYFAGDASHRFRYIYYGDLTVSLVRYSKNAVVASFSALNRTKVRLTFYGAQPFDGQLRLSGNKILGTAREKGVIPGDAGITDNDTVFKGRYEAYNNEAGARREYAVCHIIAPEGGDFETAAGRVDFEILLDADNPRILVYLAVGGSDIDEEMPSREELLRGVNNAELSYSANKIVGSGKLASNASDLISACGNHKIYNALRLSNYYVETRDTANKHYAYDPVEMSAAALVSALIGDPCRDQLSVYSGEMILGALAVWVAFCRTRDKKILADAFPKWMLRWNLDAKLIQADPVTKRETGYRMPLSPLKDTDNQPLYSLEFNSYKLIALDIMERAARILGRPEKEQIRSVLKEFRKKIKETLFDEKTGMFRDRYVSGAFAVNYGVTSFLPLLGGAVEDNETLDMLLINLTNENKFFTNCPIPTISRDNYSYGKRMKRADGSERKPYEDFTGSVLPYFNYMVYLGLTRLGVNDAAANLALRSVKIWNNYFDIYGMVPRVLLPNFKLDSNYPQSSLSGNLMGLIGISELIDVEYFNDDLTPAIRFGTTAEGEHRLFNIEIFNRKFSVAVTEKTTTLIIDGEKAFEGVGGAFVVRRLSERETGTEFLIYAKDNLSLMVNSPVLLKGGPKSAYRFNLESGKFKVNLENGRVRIKRLI